MKATSSVLSTVVALLLFFNSTLAQESILLPGHLELMSSASVFEKDMSFTIGETFISYLQNNNLTIQEGFLQTNKTKNSDLNKSTTSEIVVFPNPTLGRVVIESREKNIDLKVLSYSIFNSQGQVCLSGNFFRKPIEINMELLPSGLYMVHLLNPVSEITSTIKILKL